MDLREAILTRRSIRKYIPDRVVPVGDIDDMLNMAMHAPSARNCQAWEFVVIDNKDLHEEITKIHPYCEFLKDASLAIVVCGNQEIECEKGYHIVDACAATQNLLLGALDKGLGGCWCGLYPNDARMKAMIKLLHLPHHVRPISLVVLGYPAEDPAQPTDRYKKERVHFNGYLR